MYVNMSFIIGASCWKSFNLKKCFKTAYIWLWKRWRDLSYSFFSLSTAVQYVLAQRPPWALLIAQIPLAKPASITQQHIELAEKAMTWTSYFHQLKSEWQVAKLQNLPENPVKAKQVVKAFFISRGTRGNKWRLLLSSIPNSPLLSGWNRAGKKMSVYLTSIPDIIPLDFSITHWHLFSFFFLSIFLCPHANVIT